MAITKSAQSQGDGSGDNVEAYIARQAESVRPILEKMREAIRTAAPDATEKIAWHMPSYWQGKNLINFAAFTKHVSIFPGSEAITAFACRLTGYTTGKGTVQFQLDEPIPYDLITDIVRWKVASVQRIEIIAAFCGKLKDILTTELEVGNVIVETCRSDWLYDGASAIFLRDPFHPPIYQGDEGIAFHNVNDPHYWKADYYDHVHNLFLACKFGGGKPDFTDMVPVTDEPAPRRLGIFATKLSPQSIAESLAPLSADEIALWDEAS